MERDKFKGLLVAFYWAFPLFRQRTKAAGFLWRKGCTNTLVVVLKVSTAFKIKHLEYWSGEMSCWIIAGCGEHKDLSSNHQNVLKKECKILINWKFLSTPATNVTNTSLTKLAGRISVARKKIRVSRVHVKKSCIANNLDITNMEEHIREGIQWNDSKNLVLECQVWLVP